METLKVGLIGLGGRGHNGWHAHQPQKGVTIVAGVDVAQKPIDEFKEKFPEAKIFNNYRDLLNEEEIGAVIISSPDYLHEEMAIAALKARKAVFLEKPMAITIDGCDKILQTAMETGTKLFLGHNMRYYPVVLKMREIIQSGIIGDIQVGWTRHFIGYGGDAYFHDWHSEQRNTNGLLLQKGSHDIDVMHWLMGTYTKSVVGMGMLSVYDKCGRRKSSAPAERINGLFPPLEQNGFSPIIDVEDHNMIMMQMENGAQAAYLQCHYTPDTERNYTFIGTRGRIENIGDNGDCSVYVWNRRGPRSTPDIVYHLKPAVGSHGGADIPLVNNFLDFVMHNAKTNTSPIAARNAVAVGVLGHYSMRHGCGCQDIPSLPKEIVEYFEKDQLKK